MGNACSAAFLDRRARNDARQADADTNMSEPGAVNKNDPNDARSVGVAALRSSDPGPVPVEDQIAVLWLRARRYGDLGRARTQLVCRLRGAV